MGKDFSHKKKLHDYILIVENNGKKKFAPRLWVDGKYRPDPDIKLSEEARLRIATNIQLIRQRIEDS